MELRKHIVFPLLLTISLRVAMVPVEAQTTFGYAGKPCNELTGFIDFGYRDYDPVTGRFTTEDPVRDGYNWYSYVNQDPVNFVDLFGLKNVPVKSTHVMSTGEWADHLLNGWDKTIQSYGCAITLVSNIQNTRGFESTPDTINDKYVTSGNLSWDAYASDADMTVERIHKNFSAEDYAKQEDDMFNTYYTGIYVPYSGEGSNHWVGVEGVQKIDGVNYFVVSATSKYDTKENILQNRYDAGWIKKDDQILIPESKVNGAVVFKQEKNY